MKRKFKIGLILLSISIIFSLNAAFANTSKSISLNKIIKQTSKPAIKTNSPKISIIRSTPTIYPLNKSIDKADMIVLLEIINIPKGITPPVRSTIFTANVVKTFKGVSLLGGNNQINIIQRGNNNTSYNGYPLFKPHDKIAVFLKKVKGYTNTYSILSDEANTYKVLDLGFESFIVKLYGSDSALSSAVTPINFMNNEINKSLYLIDKNGKTYNNNHNLQTFSYNSFCNLLTSIIDNNNSKFITTRTPIPNDKNLIAASDKFGLDIFKTEIADNKKENIVISPLSLFTAFDVVMNGASGTTKEQLKSVMNINNYDDEKLNTNMNNLINSLNNYSSEEPGLTKIYNSIWINKDFNVKPNFITTSQSYYNTDIFKRELSNKSTVKEMNDWIKEKSNGLITNKIKDIPSGTKLSIFNVLHFVGKWINPFDKSQTKTESFTTSSGTNIDVKMMNAKKRLAYYEDDTVKAGIFSYYNGHMLILLPKGDINEFAAKLTSQDIQNYDENAAQYQANIKIPKLDISYNSSIIKALKEMGLQLPFDSQNANFDRLKSDNTPLWIGKVDHNCTLKLDEEGTEAAALTSVMMAGAAPLPKDIKEFYVNKPFIFVIQTNYNNILFVGKVEKPID